MSILSRPMMDLIVSMIFNHRILTRHIVIPMLAILVMLIDMDFIRVFVIFNSNKYNMM